MSTPELDDHAGTALHASLAVALPDLHDVCRDRWIVIGSAAAFLVGADVHVADIDVLTSVRDADALSDRWQMQRDAAHQPGDAGRFRSRFARYRFPGLPVEIMGGLQTFGAAGWKPLQVSEIIEVAILGAAIPVPSVAEQMRILSGFGRPKDRQRVAALAALKNGVK